MWSDLVLYLSGCAVSPRRIPPTGVSTDTIQELSWQAGFKGVPGLAKAIGRSRCTVWRAVRWPDQFGPTYKLITEALEA